MSQHVLSAAVMIGAFTVKLATIRIDFGPDALAVCRA